MFLLVVGRGKRGIYCIPLPIYVILAYNKQQYCTGVASDYRGRDHWNFSMQSPERRRHRCRFLLHLNKRKVEAFIHSVIIFNWPLCLQQLSTSDYK